MSDAPAPTSESAPRYLPLRTAATISAPEAAVRRTLARPDVWTRTFRTFGFRADEPVPRKLAVGEVLRFRSGGPIGQLPTTVATSRRSVRVVDERDGLPIVQAVLGPMTTARIALTTVSTGAGTLTTVEFQLGSRSYVLARRRLIKFGEMLLGITAITARDPQVVVAGAVIADGAVLAARRTRPAGLEGKWEMPGGKVEPGESDQQALVRELEEELGVTVEVGEPVMPAIDLGDGLLLHPYFARLGDGRTSDIRPMESDPAHDEVRWVRAGEFDDIDWLPGDAPMVEAVRAHLRRSTR